MTAASYPSAVVWKDRLIVGHSTAHYNNDGKWVNEGQIRAGWNAVIQETIVEQAAFFIIKKSLVQSPANSLRYRPLDLALYMGGLDGSPHILDRSIA